MTGFLSAPLRAGTVVKAGIVVFIAAFAVLSAAWAFIFLSMRPPREKTLIRNFESNRAAYERLREMALEDQQVRAVYVGSGVQTNTSGLPHQPSEVNFPIDRYREYVMLLQRVGSNAAFRGDGIKPDLICIGAWGSGWAGSTRHVWDCWTGQQPANQVADLDDYYRNPTRPRNVFRHIDGNWYLRADW